MIVLLIVLWYLIGLVSFIFFVKKSQGYVDVRDLIFGLIVSLGGLATCIGCFLGWLSASNEEDQFLDKKLF